MPSLSRVNPWGSEPDWHVLATVLPREHWGQLCQSEINPWGLCRTQQCLPSSRHPPAAYTGSGIRTYRKWGSKVSTCRESCAGLGRPLGQQSIRDQHPSPGKCCIPVHTHPAKAERASFPRPSPAVSSNYNLCQSVRFLLLGGCASFHMFESFPFPLLQFSAHLYTGFIIFFLLICMSLLYIMEIRPFLRYELQIFSHSFSFVFWLCLW